MKPKKDRAIRKGARICTDFFEEKVIYHKSSEQILETENTDQPLEEKPAVQFSLYKAQQKLNQQLFRAIELANTDHVIQLLERGADVNAKIDNLSPLYLSILYKNEEIAALLITHGANVNQPCLLGNTPLHAAALNADEIKIRIAQLLIMAGADVNSINDMRQTPLHFNTSVTRELYMQIAQLLIKSGAQLHHVDARGNKPLDQLDKKTRDELILFGLTCKMGR